MKKCTKSGDDDFIAIPQTTLPGGLVVPAFKVARYLTSCHEGKAVISRTSTPWTRISYRAARRAAAEAGYQLITESQALAIAFHIAAQPTNWSGGEVGAGKLFRGLHKGTVASAQPATHESGQEDERRWFDLPGGERIFDAAGNAYTWVFDDVQGDADGIVSRAFSADSPSIVIPYPSDQKGQGWTPSAGADWSGFALCRGGCWRSGVYAGVFRLNGGWPDNGYDDVGFRCTKSL